MDDSSVRKRTELLSHEKPWGTSNAHYQVKDANLSMSPAPWQTGKATTTETVRSLVASGWGERPTNRQGPEDLHGNEEREAIATVDTGKVCPTRGVSTNVNCGPGVIRPASEGTNAHSHTWLWAGPLQKAQYPPGRGHVGISTPFSQFCCCQPKHSSKKKNGFLT